jgi:glycerol-3-phosphate dehydrogenase subunit C
MIQPRTTIDMCLKCNICTASCPVVAVTDLFLGPKAVGPQAQRFRHPRLPLPVDSVEWCSGCGTCSQVCPHGVAVAELNIQTKARLAEEHRIPLRDHLISRPELLGRIASPVAPIANYLLGMSLVRWIMEKSLGISRKAPLPNFARPPLRVRQADKCVDRPPNSRFNSQEVVAYFHGCYSNYYEPELGELAIAILERLGCQVILPPQVCCGLPLQSNGLFEASRAYANTNVAALFPFAEQGINIVGTSTSCTLSLKHDYRAILGLHGDQIDAVANATYDFFEFITTKHMDELENLSFTPVNARAYYHPPCHLRGHGIGAPALRVLQRIPALQVCLSESMCCGITGTYGMKSERHQVAYNVGESLFDEIRESQVDLIISDSETCRLWIEEYTGLPTYHPLEILARGMRLT